MHTGILKDVKCVIENICPIAFKPKCFSNFMEIYGHETTYVVRKPIYS